MLPAHEEILSIQLVTNNKYARQVRSCAAGLKHFLAKLYEHIKDRMRASLCIAKFVEHIINNSSQLNLRF
jgi:hypothetical protein